MLKLRKIDMLDVACIIISVVMLVVSPSIYLMMNVEDTYLFGFVFLLFSLFLVLIKMSIYKIKKWQLIFLFTLILLDALLLMVSGTDSGTGFYIIGFGLVYFAFLSFVLDDNNKYDRLLEFVVVAITVLAIISLFFWVFGSLLKIIKPTDYVKINWGYIHSVRSYYNLYIEPQNSSFNIGDINIGTRNCAFFVEGPVCNFFFSIGLLLYEFCIGRKKRIVCVILVAAVFSTLTTTGMMVLLFYFFYKFKEVKVKRKIGKAFKFVLLFIILLTFLGIGSSALGSKLLTGSGIVRLSRLATEFAAFRNHIFFGNGINRFTDGSSNSIAALLADGGIILWGMYYVPIFGNIIYKLVKWKRIDYFSLIFGFVFAITVMQYSLIAVFIVIYIWKEFISLFGNNSFKKLR